MPLSYKYSPGQNVCHQMQCYLVFKRRTKDGAPAYFLRRCDTGEVKDLVLESDCIDCSSTVVIDKMWASFVYTGDNAAASRWMQENLFKNICSMSNISYGPNNDSTVYSFSCSEGSWTKAKA